MFVRLVRFSFGSGKSVLEHIDKPMEDTGASGKLHTLLKE